MKDQFPPDQQIRTRIIDCPRCHEQCGWCSDYRYMHGRLPLSGGWTKCNIKGFEPEGNACPVCGGTKKVRATTTYERIFGDIE